MRVLLVSDWPAEEGGLETYLSLVRAGLDAEGDDVRLLVSSLGTAAGHADYVARGHRSASVQALTQLYNPSAARTLGRAVHEFRPDVVHVSSFELQLSPLALGALRGVPLVHSIAWYKPLCPTGHKLLPDGGRCSVRRGRVCADSGCLGTVRWLRETARYALIDRRLAAASAVVTCSAHMRQRLAADGLDARWLPWPVEPPGQEFRRVPASSPLFVFAGRLSPEKGIDTLLTALATLRAGGLEARLRLVGDGPSRESLLSLARSLGIGDALELTGWTAHNEVERHLSDAWALVAPSLWAEPLGLSAVEAIVRGLPVVASADGGYAESVRAGLTGLLFPNGDAAALAACLEQIATRSAFAEGIDAAAAASLRHLHDPARHFRELRRLFSELA